MNIKFNPKKAFSSLILIALLLLLAPAVFAQSQIDKPVDTGKTIISDSLLSNVVLKVASYSATIDHSDFLIRRKFNLTPMSLDLPQMERRVQGFKSRLEKRGNQMNLRSLNSGIIMLTEVSGKLASYQNVLSNYSSELTQSNAEVKKILHDPLLGLQLTDSILQEQIVDIQNEGVKLDALQQKTLAQVNLLRNRVSITLLQATDIISDMRYLTISLKMGMWHQEQPSLFQARQEAYKSTLSEATATALQRSWLIISIYLNDKWSVVTIGLMLFIFSFLGLWLTVRRIKSQPQATVVLEPVLFLRRSVVIGCLLGFFTYLPFLFLNPPMSVLHTCELFRLLALTFLIYPFLKKDSKLLWSILSLLWLMYAISDVLLESTWGERWFLLAAGISMAALCIKIIRSQQPLFTKISESRVTKALVIFTLIQVLLSIIFNLTGRVSLAKIFGVSAVQCLVLGISLKVFCTMILEAIYLQSEATHKSRFGEFINFKTFQYRFLRILWIVAMTIWTVSLVRNLALYDLMLKGLDGFFNTTRTIGSMVFTFKSVAVFVCIIWLSSVLSKIINFFFGNQDTKQGTGRNRLGSMMLLIRLTIWTLGFCIAVAAAGIPIDRLSLMLGALGVGIGFGLQNIVNNLVSGVILAFERPLQIGDLIEVGGKIGTVKEIGVRSSKISNNQGADIIVPNGDLLSQQLINWTMQNRNKEIEFSIGVPYQANLKKVRALVRETITKNERIMQTPHPSIQVLQFGEKAIELKISFWVHDLAEAGTIRSQVMIEIYEVLIYAGIQLPGLKAPAME